MQDLDSLSLDELFKEAKAALGKQRARAVKAPGAPAEAPSYYDLSNWTKTRGVALLHQETHTVLGNFTEYVHKALPGARRLVREIEVLPFTTVEYVTGVWGGPTEAPTISAPRMWRTSRIATLDVVLKDLHVSAPGVKIEASFGEGVLETVKLAADTTFASPPGSAQESFCILPAGTNILPEMSIHSIKALLTNLGQPV